MKQFLFLYTLFLVSCTSQRKERPVAVSVLHDRTDSLFLLHPDANSILHLFQFDQDNGRAVIFRYTEIQDRLLTPVKEARLPGEKETSEANIAHEPLYRERLMGAFMDSVEHILTALNKVNDSMTLPQSYCFEKISSELSALVQLKPHRAYLLVYSNLFQNSSLLSVFNADTRNTIIGKPDSVIQKFAATNLLPDTLQNVTVVFVFLPKNRQEEELYLAMVEIYKTLLEQRKARVVIETSNTFRLYE